MFDYFKFWLAKELVPLAIIAFIALIFALLFGMAWLADQIGKLRTKKR